MKRFLRAAAWLVLIVLIALGPFLAASMQAGKANRVQEYYSSWTGVLRLWKCEGWQAGNGSLTGWLSLCIEKFEKKHPGVYVQMTDVSEETMKDFLNSSVSPPDLILFPPGMLDAPYSLMELEEETPLRAPLQPLGLWQGTRYAVPVALGGYAMAVNSSLLPDTPGNWSEAQALDEEIDLLNASKDGSYTSWSAALISMFAGSYEERLNGEKPPAGDGIDLGLSIGEPAVMPAPDQTIMGTNALPNALPEDFRKTESVYSLFVNGKIAATPVTQREIRRLQQLSETGKAPDWRVEAIGLPFTDQAALISVVASEREDLKERQALCTELIDLMLTAEMQGKLTASRAFPVIELPQIYPNQAGMREIERALSEAGLLIPAAFGKEWREYADSLMEGVGAGEGTQAALERLREAVNR